MYVAPGPIELVQAIIIIGVGLALGWRTVAGPLAAAWVVLLILAGTAAFSGLALLMAGTLRAEATLAAANLVAARRHSRGWPSVSQRPA